MMATVDVANVLVGVALAVPMFKSAEQAALIHATSGVSGGLAVPDCLQCFIRDALKDYYPSIATLDWSQIKVFWDHNYNFPAPDSNLNGETWGTRIWLDTDLTRGMGPSTC